MAASSLVWFPAHPLHGKLAMTLMKIFAFVLMAAACTSSGSGSDGTPSVTPDRIDTIQCRDGVDALCASAGCDRTLDAADHDKSLCGPGGLGPNGASMIACGDYTIVSTSGTDTGLDRFYKDGELVAVLRTVVGAGCVAGPARFDAPSCSSAQRVALAACTSP